MSHAGAPGPTAKRSRLGLGLDLKSEVGLSDGDSPLDPFSIWVPGVDPAAPYEGWNQDIKEEWCLCVYTMKKCFTRYLYFDFFIDARKEEEDRRRKKK